MTQEDKQLLLKDLCCRLPYGVIVNNPMTGDDDVLTYSLLEDFEAVNSDYPKPYLRSMSSMTEEEKQEMHNILSPHGTAIYDYDGIHTPMNHYGDFIPYEYMSRVMNYLYSKHFDVNNLIDKGLAIDCADKNIY